MMPSSVISFNWVWARLDHEEVKHFPLQKNFGTQNLLHNINFLVFELIVGLITRSLIFILNHIFFADVLWSLLCRHQSLQEPAHLFRGDCGHV